MRRAVLAVPPGTRGGGEDIANSSPGRFLQARGEEGHRRQDILGGNSVPPGTRGGGLTIRWARGEEGQFTVPLLQACGEEDYTLSSSNPSLKVSPGTRGGGAEDDEKDG